MNFHVVSFQKHENVGINCTILRKLDSGKVSDMGPASISVRIWGVLKHRYRDCQRPVLWIRFHSIKETESLRRLKPVGRNINMNYKEVLPSLFPI